MRPWPCHPPDFLLAFAVAELTRSLIVAGRDGVAVLLSPRQLIPLAAVVLALALAKKEKHLAAPALIVAVVVGTIELLGGTSTASEGVSYLLGGDFVPRADRFLSLLDSTLTILAGAFLLGGAESLTSHNRGSPALLSLRGIVGPIAILEVIVFALIAYFGLGGFDEDRLQRALLQTQLPAIALLQAMGWCCGLNGGLVLTDSIDPHWGGLTPIGVPILFVANTGLLALVLLGMRELLKGLRAFRWVRVLQQRLTPPANQPLQLTIGPDACVVGWPHPCASQPRMVFSTAIVAGGGQMGAAGLHRALARNAPVAMRRILLCALLLLGSCSRPHESSIRSEFQRTRPNAEIVSVGPGEGDGDHVYYHIRYRLPSDPAVQEEVWGYRKGPDGGWSRFSTNSPAAVSR